MEKLLIKRPVRVRIDFEKLEDVKSRLAALKLEPITPETKAAIKELARELQALARALEAVQKYSVRSVGASSVRGAKVDELEAKAAAARELARQRAAKAAQAEQRLALDREKAAAAAARGTKATQGLNQAYKSQDGYISRLIKRLAVYASFQQFANFITKVRTVTAEFELQRVSLGAIIQDQQRANSLFAEIKNFAVQSPVSIMDLTKYTKQLAAYKIGVDELFDTTKRLADVSVGLGVSMDRVILAYGQTRATGYLRASEIRQFTEMGVPIVEELAAKITEMNGKLVTAADVMELVSKRAISFELVKEVFDDMTSAGGMFYNMQEKQGNTLFGMWAKLGDAASIMYDQIGNTESVNQGMKTAIDALTEFMRNWKAAGAALAAGLGTIGVSVGAFKGIVWLIGAMKTLQKAQLVATYATRTREAAQRRLNDTLRAGTKEEQDAAQAVLYTATQQEKAALRGVKAAGIGMRIAKSIGTLMLGGIAVGATFWATEKIMKWVYGVVEAREAATRLTNALAEIKSKGMVDMSTAEKNFESLANAAVKAEDGSKRQRDALDELQRTYGNIIPAQDLQLEKLRAMNGEYTSLTAAIKENIAQQMLQQSVDTIKEEYAPKLKKTRGNLQEYLGSVVDTSGRRIFDERQAERVVENYERNIEKGLNASQALREALELEGEEYAKFTRGLLKNASGPVRQFYATQVGLKNALSGVKDEFADMAGELGQYQQAWLNMQEANENMTIKAPKGSFAYSQEEKNEQIKNLRTFLQGVLGDAWSDSYASIYGSIGENADQMSELFWERIEAASDSPAQKNAIAKAKAAYYQLIPKDEVVRVFRDKAQQIAIAQRYSLDEARRYRMNDNENLKDYRKRLEDEQKKIIENLIQYNATKRVIMASGGDTTEQDNLIAAVEKEKKYVEALLATLPVFPSSSRTGAKSDPRLSILQEMVSTLKQVNKEYDELAKKEGVTKALADTQRVYADTFKNMQQLATKYKFELPEFGVPTDAASLTKYLNAIREAMKKLPKSDKAVLALQVDIDKLDIDEQQKKIEAELKRLADRISRTKTAKEFYEKILGMTGDLKLAANLSLSIYGENGEDLNKAIRDNIQATLGKSKKGVDLDFSAAVRADGSVDYDALVKIAKGYLDMGEISEDTYNKILKMRDEDRKDLAKTVEGWLKATEKAKTYSDKLLDLRRNTQREIDSINEKEARGQISPEFSESQRAGFLRKEAEEVAKLQYEAFKDSPMYVQMFDDLDNASTTMLRNMKSRMEELQGEWKNLDPTQLKEMQSRLNEIDAQLAKRNPFSTLAKAIKDYRKSLKTGKKGDAEAALDTASAQRLAAEKEYLEILKDEKATAEQVEAAKKKFNDAEAAEKSAAKTLEGWKKIEDMIKSSTGEIMQMLNWAGDIAQGIADISEAMGADEEDVQYWNDVASALSEVAGGIQDIVQAAMSVNVVDIVSSVLTAIPKMFVGFANLFSAGKIRDANKEIKRQGELLEGLEYSYGRLQKAAEKLFGGEYISNFNRQLKNLQAHAEAYRKQAEAEQSKGKKADEEKVKEYQQSQRDTLDAIADMRDELMAHFTGGTRADIARQMAESWIEARSSLSDTFAAIGDDYKEMIKKMVVEGAAARVIENALAPMWKQVDELLASGKTDAAIDKLISSMDTVVANANDGMEVLWQALEARGYDMKKLLGDSDTNLRGIERQIATASEEQVSDLATGIRTQNFYIGQQLEEVRAIRKMLEGRGALTTDGGQRTVDVRAMQEQALNHLAMIERYTGETAARCERAAIACEEQVTMMRRVIVPKGTKGSHGVQVYMQ